MKSTPSTGRRLGEDVAEKAVNVAEIGIEEDTVTGAAVVEGKEVKVGLEADRNLET